jgi:hypothetical protein
VPHEPGQQPRSEHMVPRCMFLVRSSWWCLPPSSRG